MNFDIIIRAREYPCSGLCLHHRSLICYPKDPLNAIHSFIHPRQQSLCALTSIFSASFLKQAQLKNPTMDFARKILERLALHPRLFNLLPSSSVNLHKPASSPHLSI